jgi:branched-chain amino acid transport system substrate-binding protein
MRHWKGNFWYKFAALILALVLLVPILAACGGGKEETTPTQFPTSTPTTVPTTTPTLAPTMTPTPTASTEPVKIGYPTAWSGPLATSGSFADAVIKTCEYQVKQMGGILGGRTIQVIKFDDRGQVSELAAGWTKFALDDKVTAVVVGGSTAASAPASADYAEQYKIPFFSSSPAPTDLTQYPHVVRAGSYAAQAVVDTATDFLLNSLKTKTVAYLGEDTDASHERFASLKKALEASGVQIVYEQYAPLDATDFSSYLTKIKYLNPDVLVCFSSNPSVYVTVFKQIMELGGWGNIKFFALSPASAISKLDLPGAKGTYHWVIWLPDSTYPVSQQFLLDFKAAGNPMPPSSVYMMNYLGLMTAIQAIKFAGTTDSEGIMKAARSGNFEWDSPIGPLRISANGENNIKGVVTQVVEGGKLTQVYPQ